MIGSVLGGGREGGKEGGHLSAPQVGQHPSNVHALPRGIEALSPAAVDLVELEPGQH